ncbi:PDGLE domain-containing protein [Mahella australiensis]|uniref:Cobalamin (Vitamin B12) biosynthesis CbiM protein n=1 Tax=Mahella australiensis (strain DSM 15567 / CIP 107919 / 50-1 BON) TaxID=697281 RepID=F4A1R8_MAHA5|nr:PDGLE domain-containing protein [Mahella australiensis]AEE97118.1 cobalamin (vitamin B12) biosynthesis CbiM protein [Mahella australiensis 50-1 BON]
MNKLKKLWPWLLVVLLLVLTPFASSFPDGLERVADDLGFTSLERDAGISLMPDYTIPVVEDGAASTIIAGIIGVVVLLLIFWAIDKAVRIHKRNMR